MELDPSECVKLGTALTEVEVIYRQRVFRFYASRNNLYEEGGGGGIVWGGGGGQRNDEEESQTLS